jgi:hypothetical protein
MGDLIRKYIALDGYVRHYLPIRGAQTMRDTLRHYRVADAPSFRLVLNAIHLLLAGVDRPMSATNERPARAPPRDLGPGARASGDAMALAAFCRRTLATLPAFGDDEEGKLLRDVAEQIGERVTRWSGRASTALADAAVRADLGTALRHLASSVEARDIAPAPIAQRLMEADLSAALLECATRVAECDRALAGAR